MPPAPGFSYEQVPFILSCGLSLSFVVTAVTLTGQRPLGDVSLTCLSLTAASLLRVGLAVVFKDRRRLYGYRLALGGLYLSTLPFLALFVAALK